MNYEIFTLGLPFLGRLNSWQRCLKSIYQECKIDHVTDEQSTKSEVKNYLLRMFSYLCS